MKDVISKIFNAIRRMFTLPKSRNQIRDFLSASTIESVKRAIRTAIDSNLAILESEDTRRLIVDIIIDSISRAPVLKTMGKREREVILALIKTQIENSGVLDKVSESKGDLADWLYDQIVKALGL